MKKNLFIIIFCFFFICCFSSVAWGIDANPPEATVIRVGFPIQKGFSEMNENGHYSGYTYDYLLEIAQYTGWQYEFVTSEGDINAQLVTLLDMLEKGEIDLMGAMNYNNSLAQKFDYPGYNYGLAYSALYVLANNTEITESNLFTKDTLRVIVQSSIGKKDEALEQFAQMSGFSVEQIFSTEKDEMLRLLESGQADAVLAKDVNIPFTGLRIVARFSPQAFYLATTPGNSKIVSDLNRAIANINDADPYFATNLHEKYFGSQSTEFFLSNEEKQYVANGKPLQVGILGGKAPIQYFDKNKQDWQGISRIVLERIKEESGLQFTYRYTESFQEYLSWLENDELDLVVGVLQNNALALDRGYVLTVPYINAPLSVVVNKNIDPASLNGKKLALPQDYILETKTIGLVERYPNVASCLAAVNDGLADYTYCNSYSAQYYTLSNQYSNLLAIPQADNRSQKICFGVVRKADANLLSILNRGIHAISEADRQSFLYQNAYQPEAVTLSDYLRQNPLQAVGLLALIILFSLVVFLLWYSYNKKIASRRIALENERYVQLSELSNEFLYEYDKKRDYFHLTEKSAQFFDCDRDFTCFSKKIQSIPVSERIGIMALGERILAAEDGIWDFLCTLPNTKRIWLRINCKTILGANGEVCYIIGKITDVQKEKDEKERLLE